MSEAALQADVLVLGGGLSATWAAAAAAASGVDVILADKGFCGTSGVTATAGPGHWWVPPDPAAREAAIREREALGEGLAERSWMARILDETWRTLPTIGVYYAFPRNEAGVVQYRNLRGPEYMRAMRRFVRKSGVRIMDSSPALELLLHADGSVAGASGIDRVTGTRWTVRAGAVVMATGGCAFMSHLLGCHTNTGDGALMAAEAGAEFSGMEFSAYYTVAPAFSTMTRSMSYAFGTYTDAGGHELDIPSGRAATEALARAMLAGLVYCSLHRMPADIRARLTRIQPNLMLPFDRHRIDPFTDRFPVTLHGEGTIRGTGGLRITGDDCATTVPACSRPATPRRGRWWPAPRPAAARRTPPGRCHPAAGRVKPQRSAPVPRAAAQTARRRRSARRDCARPKMPRRWISAPSSPPCKPRCCPTTKTCSAPRPGCSARWSGCTGYGVTYAPLATAPGLARCAAGRRPL